MKMLVERDNLSGALPVSLEQAKSHARIFFDDDDAELTNMVHAAASEIEDMGQLALLNQTIRFTIFDPSFEDGVRLPIGPVADDAPPTITMDGVDFTDFSFVGGQRAYVRWGPTADSMAPDRITLTYQAGFGDDPSNVPKDLVQAVLDQAALHYDARSPMNKRDLTTSPHASRITARYRGVQV